MMGIEAAPFAVMDSGDLANYWLARMLGVERRSDAWYSFFRPPMERAALIADLERLRWLIRAADRCALAEAGA